MDVGKNIRELREKRGIEQLELAERVKISQSKMNKIETGYQKRLEPEILAAIADELGVTTDRLLGKTNDSSLNLPELTTKDERDIAKRMEKLKKDLLSGKDSDGLSFHGEPMSEEAIESLLESLELLERQTTLINKKFIPKKHRDDQ